jgi:hypothetical protein
MVHRIIRRRGIMLTNDEKTELEMLIDRHSLADVLMALAHIAREKEEHITINWQDRATAKPWDRAAKVLDKAMVAVDV